MAELYTLSEMLEANETFSDEEVSALKGLRSGQCLEFGGGAAPVFKILRVVDQRPRTTTEDAMFEVIEVDS